MKKAFLLFASILCFVVSKAQNNALNFDGVDDYVSVPANNNFDLTSGTIECWVKPHSLSSSMCILGNRGTSASLSRYSFHLGAGEIGHWDGTNYFAIQHSFSAENWYHFAFVCNGPANKVTYYLNGIQIGETNYGFGITTRQPLIIGAVLENSGPQNMFNGIIDEIRIWSTMRTSAEISANYTNSMQGSETGLIALYNFNDGNAAGDNTSVTSSADQTGHNSPGTLHNFALTGSNSNFVTGILSNASSSTSAWLLNGNSGTNPSVQAIGTVDDQRLAFKINNLERMTLTTFVNPSGITDYGIGINTNAPNHNFSVIGNSGFSVGRPGGTNYCFFEPVLEGSNTDWWIGLWNGGFNNNLMIDAKSILFGTRDSHAKVGIGTQSPQAALDVSGNIFTSGKLAIGTTDLGKIGTYSLAVNGDAIFNKVKVKLYSTGWPDYVFKKHFNLPSLKSVEKFIKKNNHLPGVPGAEEIDKNDLDIGENQAMLLKKIEELTLYLIEQDKRISEQERKLSKQRKEIEHLKGTERK